MQNLSEVKANRDLQLSVREALSSKREVFPKESVTAEPLYNSDDEASFDARMRLQILSKRKELGDLPTKQKFRNGNFLLSITIYSLLFKMESSFAFMLFEFFFCEL